MFPAHDEIRVKRLTTGYLTELVKDNEVHTKLFDSYDSPHTKNTFKKLLETMDSSCP